MTKEKRNLLTCSLLNLKYQKANTRMVAYNKGQVIRSIWRNIRSLNKYLLKIALKTIPL